MYAIDLLDPLVEYAVEHRGLGETIDDHHPIGFRVLWQVIEARSGKSHDVLTGLGEGATSSQLVVEFYDDEWGDTIASVSPFHEDFDFDTEQLSILAEIASSRSSEITQLG